MPSLGGATAARSWRSYLAFRSLKASKNKQLVDRYTKPEAHNFASKRTVEWRSATCEDVWPPSKPFCLSKDFAASNICTSPLFTPGQVSGCVEGLGSARYNSASPSILLSQRPSFRESVKRTAGVGSRGYTTAMPTDAQIKSDALSIIKQAEKLPSLVVFDLDYTIWPFWCEVKTTRSQPRLYPEVRGIIEALKEAGIPMAVASRTPSPNIATVFLGKLQLTSFLAQQEIYPTFTHKTEHFKAILEGTKVAYDEMLFFDDEDRNVNTISPLGVKCVLVEDGVNLNALKEGLAKFRSSQRRSFR